MKRALPWLMMGLLACLALTGCRPEPLHDGDTVTPVLQSRVWTAGQANNLLVRLQADDGSGPRLLDFDSVPGNVNPEATVTFYQGDRPGRPLSVTLSHRC